MLYSLVGAKVPGSESSRVRKFQGAKVPGSESSRVRKFQGAKVPHLELSLPRANGLGSEKSSSRLDYRVLLLQYAALSMFHAIWSDSVNAGSDSVIFGQIL